MNQSSRQSDSAAAAQADNSTVPAQTTHSHPHQAPATASPNQPKVQQPKPQVLPSRSGPNSILVSPRQKGNPILNSVRNVAWEYSDTLADYVLGTTTCALFLSLKYHRLHPEYIYNRIRDLRGQFALRILLTMVDIENHEESLRELSKTSLMNNVTIILCWSAQEAGRYLELFKMFENAAPTSIKAQQSTTYSDRLVDFITVPRSINKTDAVGLVSNFGSVRTAVNASPDELGLIAGWGEKKVQRWCNSVREPFRIKRGKKHVAGEQGQAIISKSESTSSAQPAPGMWTQASVGDAVPPDADRGIVVSGTSNSADADRRPDERLTGKVAEVALGGVVETGARCSPGVDPKLAKSKSTNTPQAVKRKPEDDDISEGIMAALSKLRKQ